MSVKEEIKVSKVLAEKIERITKKLDAIIRVMAVTKAVSNLFWSKIRVEIKKQYKKAKKVYTEWAIKTIPIFYRKQAGKNLSKIKSFKNIKKIKIQSIEIGDINIPDFKNKLLNRETIKNMIQDAIAGYTLALNSGEKAQLRLASLIQQQNISNKQIQKQIDAGLVDPSATFDVNAKQINETLKKSLDGKYIAVIDKNGKTSMWGIDTYTEMYTRTKLREISSSSVVNTALSVGSDLVQVSSHNTQTAFDAQFEGKIFSLSGADPDFPQATVLPPFHPNCLHVITVVFREILERRGIQQYIDFASGKSQIHPTRKGHIPISERKNLK